MSIAIDAARRVLTVLEAGESRDLDLYSKEAFALVSRHWVRIGWSLGYTFSFTWMGLPIIQLPEDVIRVQELIYGLRPDVIVETGVALGGSVVFYASLLRAMNGGRVIGVDRSIPDDIRAAIEKHEMGGSIVLLEGHSTAPAVVEKVASLIRPDDRVLVLLDSDHSKRHVADELEQYHQFVTPGSYIVATDGIVADLSDVPHGSNDWSWDHPAAAAAEFAARHPEFALAPPTSVFHETPLAEPVTYWSGGWLRRIR